MRNVRLVICAAALVVSVTAAPGETAPSAMWAPTYPRFSPTAGGLSAFADGTVHALIGDLTPGAGHHLRSRDFGATWTAHAAVSDGLWFAKLAMSTPRAGYAIGIPPPSGGRQVSPYDGGLLVTADGTASWKRYALPRPPLARYFHTLSLRASPSGRSAIVTGLVTTLPIGVHDPGAEVVFAADSGRTMRRARLGSGTGTWAVPALADDRTAAVAVREWDPLKGTAKPGAPCCPEYTTGIWVTRDAGRSWQRTAVLNDEIHSLDWVRGKLMLASVRHGTIYESRDTGRTFTAIGAVRLLAPPANDHRTHPPYTTIDFVDDRRGFASTCQSGMWSTRDGGRTWELEASPNHGDIYVFPYCSFDGIAGADYDHAVSWYHGGLLSRRLLTGGAAPR